MVFMPERVISPAKLLHFLHGSVGRLERPDPGVALDVVANVPGGDGMPGGKRRAANHALHVLGDDLFVADPILHRADRAVFIKDVRDLRDGGPRVNRLGRDDAIIAARQLFRDRWSR